MNSPIAKAAWDRYGAALQHRGFRWVRLGSLGGQSAYWALIVARGIYRGAVAVPARAA